MSRANLPLTALRSFEAAGRHESFTAAARELFVTQAAISRQIRELEGRLGVILFDRLPQQVRLTPEGSRLLAIVTPAFEALDEALSQSARAKSSSHLHLTVEPGFAACWLLPHLAEFQNTHPEVDIELDTDTRVIDLRSHGPEMAIRYSATRKHWEGCNADLLISQTLIPVLSPEMAGAKQALSDPKHMLDHRLIYEAGTTDWELWCKQMGLERAGQEHGSKYDHMGLILQAVLRGQGVALIDELFVADYLVSGELITAFDRIKGKGGYWLVQSSGAPKKPATTSFVKWLRKALEGTAITS